MAESEQTRSDKDIILDARVTVYIDGMIITRFTENKIGQAGILTTLDDHCLRILVRGKGQLGQVWPLRDSSGNIPYITYSSMRKISELQLYIHDSKDRFEFPQVGSAEPLNTDNEYKFNSLLDFEELHSGARIEPNILAPLKIPQGKFYMAQMARFKLKKQREPHFPNRVYDFASLTGAAIEYELSKRCYLILDAKLPAGSQNHKPSLLPAIIPLEPWARYEVIIQNAPVVEGYPSDHAMHFESFYAAFPNVNMAERYIMQLAYPPSVIRAYPNSPPCTSPRYSVNGSFEWVPDGAGHH